MTPTNRTQRNRKASTLAQADQIEEGRRRAVIESVRPEIDAGRYPIKRTLGESISVEADAFTDGHDQVRCLLLYRKEEIGDWTEVAMLSIGNDRWRGTFQAAEIGRYRYTIMAWTDGFLSWRHDLARRVEENDIALALQVGVELVDAAARRAEGRARSRLVELTQMLGGTASAQNRRELALSIELEVLMLQYPDREFATLYDRELEVVVDTERARFSAWYEMFPRSCAAQPAMHGTFKDCEARLGYIADMGFDVLYLPPIHPIGRVRRKGRNNTLSAQDNDPGSPWAIGAREGGHKAVHPELGTLEDFRRLLAKALKHGIDIALDIAFQCAPDHPYVAEHPAWFRWRPDDTVQYAENPPKKYQDIYPFNFESADWQALWRELASVVEFWIGEGVKIFRVDNPHTKPFPFWEWLIRETKKRHPEIIFLAEAFTRPKVMHRLAKLGFNQSYTYFAWRNTKSELTQYFTELTRTDTQEYFRPNAWPNTPDILTEYLQVGGRPAFMARLVLAATLAANYGIYGPAFELCESTPREPGSEEYLNSEKYEIKRHDLNRPDSLKAFIARVNRVRRENPALQQDRNLRFYPIDNDEMICFGKSTDDGSSVVVVVNLDPHHTQSGWVELPLATLGIEATHPYQVHELLSGARYLWTGWRNYVQLDPQVAPAHIFRVRRRVRTERDFDYFM